MTAAGLLVAGTSSDAGKSLVTVGLCRYFARQGIRVAPFKAQNMSNNSMVCLDGMEIGRAQYLQAQAARAVPESAMNPVLLKPGSDRRSFVVVRGKPAGVLKAGEFASGRAHLAQAAFAAYEELAECYDLVVCEGAGSPTEINLRAGDYVNLGLAQRFSLPTLVVGDIDRGGVFAALYGTVALLDAADRALIRGLVINKFRGDITLLKPGLERIAELTGVPVLGVLPWLDGVWLDGEDALQVGRWAGQNGPTEPDPLRVAVVRFPRLSNVTDVDALACEPGVQVTMTADPVVLRSSDVVVLPGSRSTAEDLQWLRRTGLAAAVGQAASRGVPVLGICGGYQMMASWIDDPIESGVGRVHGLGLLPTTVTFGPEKVLRRTTGRWRGIAVSGYEIHHGVATPGRRLGTEMSCGEPFLDGYCLNSTWGTMWHGAFECDDFRRGWLAAATSGGSRPFRPAPDAPGFAERREMMIDTLADAVEEHLDTTALLALLSPPRLNSGA